MSSSRLLAIVLVSCCALSGCSTTSVTKKPDDAPRPGPGQYEVFGKIYTLMEDNLGYLDIGIASWYGRKFHGRLTAMGETYDMFGLTAAHKALPLPTVVKVTNLDNGRSIVVRVNDRGPFHDDRLIDLSWSAAKALGFEDKGTAPVVVEALDEVNHPELMTAPPQESYYLQVGAFRSKLGATLQLNNVKQVLPEGIPAQVLTSETETNVLYKVWVGPIQSLEQEKVVEEKIAEQRLGRALRVTIE